MSDQTPAAPSRRRLWLTALPVLVFAALAALFWKGLSGDPSTIPSVLIGKPAPDVKLPPVQGIDAPSFDGASLKAGNVTVLNVWASWCVPCREEHPLLMELGKRTDIKLVGINYKDDAANASAFLNTLGQPFRALDADIEGRATIDWGVYGVPETYVIDGQGMIRYKVIGPLSPDIITGQLNPQIELAKKPLAK